MLQKALGVPRWLALAFLRVLLAVLELVGVRPPPPAELTLSALGRIAWVCACPLSRRSSLSSLTSPMEAFGPHTPHSLNTCGGG